MSLIATLHDLRERARNAPENPSGVESLTAALTDLRAAFPTAVGTGIVPPTSPASVGEIRDLIDAAMAKVRGGLDAHHVLVLAASRLYGLTHATTSTTVALDMIERDLRDHLDEPEVAARLSHVRAAARHGVVNTRMAIMLLDPLPELIQRANLARPAPTPRKAA